jgi:hypothetical protein
MSGEVAIVAPTPAKPCCRAISERIQVHSRMRASSSGGIGRFSTASAYDCELLWAHPRSGSVSAKAAAALLEIDMLTPQGAPERRSGVHQINFEIPVKGQPHHVACRAKDLFLLAVCDIASDEPSGTDFFDVARQTRTAWIDLRA